MSTTTFQVSGMHCSSCSMLVTLNLEDLPGVTKVECDHATGRTSVDHDPALVGAPALADAIEAAGYAVELVG